MVILEVKIYILFGSEISEQKLYSVESKGNTIREFPGDGSFLFWWGQERVSREVCHSPSLYNKVKVHI